MIGTEKKLAEGPVGGKQEMGAETEFFAMGGHSRVHIGRVRVIPNNVQWIHACTLLGCCVAIEIGGE
jgi:hypothetical protein